MMDGMLPTSSPARMSLTTPRLLLRDYRAEDSPVLQQLVVADEPKRCQESRGLRSMPVRQPVLKTGAGPLGYPRAKYMLVIELHATRQVVGVCGLAINRANWSEAELCYAITPRFQGYGYASEAVSALLAFGFEELQLRRIFGMCRANDIGSGRVMEKAGMRLESRLCEHARAENDWRERLLYGILDHDWDARGLYARCVC